MEFAEMRVREKVSLHRVIVCLRNPVDVAEARGESLHPHLVSVGEGLLYRSAKALGMSCKYARYNKIHSRAQGCLNSSIEPLDGFFVKVERECILPIAHKEHIRLYPQ